MIDYDGISFNDLISGQIMSALARHDPHYAGLPHEQVPVRVSRFSFMASIASVNDLEFFPQIAQFCDTSLVAQCDRTVLARGLFIPMCHAGPERVIVAMANPWSSLAEEYLAPRFPGMELVRVVTLASEINRAIDMAASGHDLRVSAIAAADMDDNEDAIHDFDVTHEHDEPMAETMATILAMAVKSRASDIHFKVEKESFYYSYRINGDLGKRYPLPMRLKDRLDAFLLNLMKLPTENRHVQPGISGRFTISYYHRPIDIRYERHRSYRGYHITLRLLDKNHLNVTLGKGSLAFDEESLFALQRAMRIPAGILVMSGPTGSGKSTTLNAILRELNRLEVNILTLENPVEDEVPGVTHCDLRDAKEFKPMIASFMRSDPDIILMGEVRDFDSAELAIEAAITGHKVITTIHTPRASQIIERFEQLGIERWKIAQTLKAACAQRLVKTLCPYCRKLLHGIPAFERKTFFLDDSWADVPIHVAHPGGCNECRHTGYGGRTAIFEIIPITPRVSDLLAKGVLSPYELELEIEAEGILPNLRQSGLHLLRDGVTDLAALSQVIDMTYAIQTSSYQAANPPNKH